MHRRHAKPLLEAVDAPSISPGFPKPFRTIEAPSAASARAIPSPIPLVEPVTTATLPCNGRMAARSSGATFMFMATSARLTGDRRAPSQFAETSGNAGSLPFR